MRTFTVIWLGQLVSLVGTAMTRFALLIWAYEQTGSATTVALLGFFSYAPYVVASPLAGVWVDRLDRRLVMVAADLGAGLMTATLLLLYTVGSLHIWQLFLAQALSGVFDSFQRPAYTAATTTLLSPAQYARASGMRSLADAGSQVAAPLLAGILLTLVDIEGVMLVDLATFLAAMGTLWGGPRRRIHGVLAFAALSFLLGDTLFATGHQATTWVAGAFLAAFFIPFILAADRTIWQTRVAPAIQGRVFAVQGMARTVAMPLGYLLAGPLADHVFEPAMASGGRLASLFGPLVGTGPGAGMGLMFLGTAVCGTLMSLSGYLFFKPVHLVEDELPEFETTPEKERAY